MKKYKKRIVPDYDNKYVDTDPKYYGVFFEKENQKIVSIKCDGYLSNITVTTYQEDLVDSVFETFYYIKNI